MMKSRAGTGFVVGAAAFSALGVTASLVLPAVLPAAPVAAETVSVENRAASSKELDGWIRQALTVMKDHKIPGSYDGLHKNIIRESGGNPRVCNDWDINAQRGIPSCGLLQVIPPTFATHYKPLKGDPRLKNSVYDPVTNLVVASRYAWKRYGSIDNVNGPY